MSLIIYLIFFILYNIHPSQTIQFDTSCSSNTYYNFYNSLSYSCVHCENNKKSPYVCYSNDGISIYTFEQNPSLLTDCSNSNMIELDGNRKLLERPICIKNEFNYTDINSTYTSHSSSPGTIGTTIDNSNSIIFRYEKDELNYYRHACLDGYYERGCDYSSNLCALSLYISTNPFCTIINDLNEKLFNNDIL